MTEYTLLQFPDRLVLVSDEEKQIGGFAFHKHPDLAGDYAILPVTENNCFSIQEHWNKVIAGHGSLPSVDVTAIAEKIGWVDVESLAIAHWHSEYLMAKNEETKQYIVNDFKAGFHKAQELNKNKFTEEDMKACWLAAENSILQATFIGSGYDPEILWSQAEVDRDKDAFFHGISKQHPKQWRVEVDMIDNFPGTGERVRITNNTIKVTKVVEQ